MIGRSDVSFRDHEVLSYEVGSHFAPHSDRSREHTHIGTILLVRPWDGLRGGVLRDVDNGGACYEGGTGPFYTYNLLGVRHEVTVVTKSGRFVAKAAVHVKDSAGYNHERWAAGVRRRHGDK